jgi:hypothetical protein
MREPWVEWLSMASALLSLGLLIAVWWPQTKDEPVPLPKPPSIYWEISWKHIARPDIHWVYAREDDESDALYSFYNCIYARGFDTVCELWEHDNGFDTLKRTFDIDFPTWDRLHPARKDCNLEGKTIWIRLSF